MAESKQTQMPHGKAMTIVLDAARHWHDEMGTIIDSEAHASEVAGYERQMAEIRAALGRLSGDSA